MGRRLPTGRVITNVVQQEVDLRPPGNTIAVTTLADNPFEENAAVEVVTQASSGGYEVPANMRSHHLLHSYLPGLGEGEMDAANAVKESANTAPGFLDFLTTAATKTGEVLTAREARKAAEAGVQPTSAPTTVLSPSGQPITVIPQRGGGMSTTMLVIGGVALVGLGAFFLMGRKGKRKRR